MKVQVTLFTLQHVKQTTILNAKSSVLDAPQHQGVLLTDAQHFKTPIAVLPHSTMHHGQLCTRHASQQDRDQKTKERQQLLQHSCNRCTQSCTKKYGSKRPHSYVTRQLPEGNCSAPQTGLATPQPQRRSCFMDRHQHTGDKHQRRGLCGKSQATKNFGQTN